MLPIVLQTAVIDTLFAQVDAIQGYKLNVDLVAQTVNTPSGDIYSFEVDAFHKHCLINGLDDIGLTMQQQDKIKLFEQKHQLAQPWLFQ